VIIPRPHVALRVCLRCSCALRLFDSLFADCCYRFITTRLLFTLYLRCRCIHTLRCTDAICSILLPVTFVVLFALRITGALHVPHTLHATNAFCRSSYAFATAFCRYPRPRCVPVTLHRTFWIVPVVYHSFLTLLFCFRSVLSVPLLILLRFVVLLPDPRLLRFFAIAVTVDVLPYPFPHTCYTVC